MSFHPSRSSLASTVTLFLLLVLQLVVENPCTYALVIPSATRPKSRSRQLKRFLAESHDNSLEDVAAPSDSSRREMLTKPILLACTAAFMAPSSAFAKGTEAEDKAKILSGYKRLTYLLDNWDKETTFCGTERDPYSGKQVCEKTPLVVQEYMGYKNINDPLFKADKTLLRLEEFVPASRETEYLDALEKWQMTADEASGMAYTSSWAGPQNPNGGDEAISFYLERARKQTEEARGILAQVIDILDLKS